MDNLNSNLAKNLRTMRNEKNLSLDELSKLTDVAKNMLEEIEREETNPSITTVWKITNGLKVSFSSLVDKVQSDAKLFEVYKIGIKKGSRLSSEPHPRGTYEYITLFSSKLMVLVSGKEYSLSKGDALKFDI